MVHAVISAEAGTQTVQEASLCIWSMRRHGFTDPITLLLSAKPGGELPAPLVDAEVVAVENYAGLEGGVSWYQPYNKPGSLSEWLRLSGGSGGPQSTSVLVLDPDMVLVEPLGPLTAVPGHPVAQGGWSWMSWDFCPDPVRGMSQHPELVQPAGVPYLVAVEDLQAICPGWITHTRTLRQARVLHDPWVAEMVAYVLACADLGLSQELWNWDCGPFVHYFGAPPSSHCLSGDTLAGAAYEWNKTRYDWAHWPAPPAPPAGANAPTQEFQRLLTAFAGQQGSS